jgi:1,4-dihydroxy-2-naphthoate octaprenyltransferase
MTSVFRLFTGLGQIFIRIFVGFYIISIIAYIGDSRFNVLNVSAGRSDKLPVYIPLLKINDNLGHTLFDFEVFFDPLFALLAFSVGSLDLYCNRFFFVVQWPGN